jgi:thiol-disulfide isomerase/thioredoxin
MSLSIGTQCPDFPDDMKWLTRHDVPPVQGGRPLLIHFWAVSCPFCKANFPVLEAWRDKYSPVKQIAVHTPRMETDRDMSAIAAAIDAAGMRVPCLLDHDATIAGAFQTHGMFPQYFLFDEHLKMRSRAAGKGGLTLIEMALQRLMAASEQKVT